MDIKRLQEIVQRVLRQRRARIAAQNSRPLALWYKPTDIVARKAAYALLEEGHTYKLDKRWHVRYDVGLQPNQQDHLHVYNKQNHVCVINKDGTPSHNSIIDLPKAVRSRIARLGLVPIKESVFLTEDASFDDDFAAGIPLRSLRAFERFLLMS